MHRAPDERGVGGMNVAELIEYLQTLDPTIRVVTAASEDGFFDIGQEENEQQFIPPDDPWRSPMLPSNNVCESANLAA
jgi:hypothetical protein